MVAEAGGVEDVSAGTLLLKVATTGLVATN
jgi:hypothetical protein